MASSRDGQGTLPGLARPVEAVEWREGRVGYVGGTWPEEEGWEVPCPARMARSRERSRGVAGEACPAHISHTAGTVPRRSIRRPRSGILPPPSPCPHRRKWASVTVVGPGRGCTFPGHRWTGSPLRMGVFRAGSLSLLAQEASPGRTCRSGHWGHLQDSHEHWISGTSL